MNLNEDPCLDLAEAINLLNLIHFVCEHADNAQDWFQMRDKVYSCAYATERLIQAALFKAESIPQQVEAIR